LAASLERSSEHPLASAVVRGAKTRKLELLETTNFRSVTAGGVVGRVGGRDMAVGKRSFIEAEGVSIPSVATDQVSRWQGEGKTVLFVAADRRAAGLLAVADPIKGTTREAVTQLRDLKIELVMATGDNRGTAESVAKALGIGRFEAEIEPAGKIRLVENLRREGKRVAMAGDGINDAPALAAADVGIAMGTGSDVAIESGSVTLVKGDLRAVAKAIHLSRATLRNIRQNLFFAFIYNLVGVPVAAGLLYPLTGALLSPMWAGAAMSLSSVSVITNALRLRNVKL
ncbi:MAG: HAD-IC family P-type ATPase, partial [Opitutus sp.]